MSSLSCEVSMTTLTSTYQYTFDQLVQVRVSAINKWGPSSTMTNIGTARIRSVPSTMSSPTISSYTDTSITLTWTALADPATGNSPILSYSLYWNEGTLSSPSVALIDSLVTTYTISGLTGGQTYSFIIAARNIYGYGTYSSASSVLTVDIPG
jgi:hypothetical protein